MRASGTFTVSMKPQTPSEELAGGSLGRMLLDKQFEGGLVAVGKGEMLTAITQIQGSAGYVAIEHVTGTLHGQQGSFVFQHSGTMTRGAQQLAITVVPDSGTEALTGITGQFTLSIVDSQHFYEFEYSLPQ
ncbi:DUF3224 domain-containing protein [Candidatus Cyanaurora vandensis]|uniref:DUF3224 domain-containing protein n=1 Tax=Candidatus Cyanaurora vandensis TaxID=2714958 RepID=UPI00257A97C3|nr:DUF3224 domain-containing protein [Candidatus Cyanaurora vandensis]